MLCIVYKYRWWLFMYIFGLHDGTGIIACTSMCGVDWSSRCRLMRTRQLWITLWNLTNEFWQVYWRSTTETLCIENSDKQNKLCKSVYPWESVSEIQFIKETKQASCSTVQWAIGHLMRNVGFCPTTLLWFWCRASGFWAFPGICEEGFSISLMLLSKPYLLIGYSIIENP